MQTYILCVLCVHVYVHVCVALCQQLFQCTSCHVVADAQNAGATILSRFVLRSGRRCCRTAAIRRTRSVRRS